MALNQAFLIALENSTILKTYLPNLIRPTNKARFQIRIFPLFFNYVMVVNEQLEPYSIAAYSRTFQISYFKSSIYQVHNQ